MPQKTQEESKSETEKTESVQSESEMSFYSFAAEKDADFDCDLISLRRSSFAFDEPEGAKEVLLGKANESSENTSSDEDHQD